jgi:hypothetical protein
MSKAVEKEPIDLTNVNRELCLSQDKLVLLGKVLETSTSLFNLRGNALKQTPEGLILHVDYHKVDALRINLDRFSFSLLTKSVATLQKYENLADSDFLLFLPKDTVFTPEIIELLTENTSGRYKDSLEKDYYFIETVIPGLMIHTRCNKDGSVSGIQKLVAKNIREYRNKP